MCQKMVISQMPGEKSLASFRLCNTRVDVEFSYWLDTCNCLTKIYTDDFFGSSRFLSKEMASLFVFGGSAVFFALIITKSCCCFTGSISHHLARPRVVQWGKTSTVVLYLGPVHLGFGYKHCHRVCLCWRPPRQETVPRTKCSEDSTLHHPPTSPVVVEHSKRWGKYKEVVSKFFFYTTVDLFDSVEMLDIVLDEKEHNYGNPKGFGA